MNKKIYIALVGLLSLSISVFLFTHRQLKHSKSQVQNSQFGEFEFEEKIHDFGQIKSGDTVSHNFRFFNKGTVPLVIEDISTSCGCTVASWPKNPIPSNNNGKILLTFSKSHQPGVYNKTAIIKANTKDTYTAIKIRATVVE